jgi:transposase-like protein
MTVTDARPTTLIDAITYFVDPDRNRAYLVSRRWPNGVVCPVCGSRWVYVDASRNGWECKTRHVKRKFTVKTGTIFEESPLGFDKWLPAIWMVANQTQHVSSHQVARTIGVTQKTAWYMLERIVRAVQAAAGASVNQR